jgi:hypothetical protein
LGRTRTRETHLPRRLHLRAGVYWYVTNAKPRKWIRLGTDYRRALARWAELEGGHSRETVATLVDRFVDLLEVKPSSAKQYRSWAKALREGLGNHAVDALTTHHVAIWRDANSHRKAYVNGCLATLRGAYDKAREWGWCAHDPCPKGFARATRNRLLTHGEFRRVRDASVPWLQLRYGSFLPHRHAGIRRARIAVGRYHRR